MLSSKDENLKTLPTTMEQALSDKEVWLRCEARRRYEENQISIYSSGHRKGVAEGLSRGQDKMLSLIQEMTKHNENHLIPQLHNPEFLKEMYQKYQIH